MDAIRIGEFVVDQFEHGAWRAMLNGVPVEPHRKITITLEVGKRPVVVVEYVLDLGVRNGQT